LAREGEELVVHRFQTSCIGLAAPSDLCPNPEPPEARSFWAKVKQFFDPEANPVPAVCIPPGATLQLSDIPRKLQREFRIGSIEFVTFTQVTAAESAYRDAVRFCNGHEVILQRLREGQRVLVLALGYGNDSESVTPMDALRAQTGPVEDRVLGALPGAIS
jgi:hypothetical protein